MCVGVGVGVGVCFVCMWVGMCSVSVYSVMYTWKQNILHTYVLSASSNRSHFFLSIEQLPCLTWLYLSILPSKWKSH